MRAHHFDEMKRATIKISGFIGYDTDLNTVQQQLLDAEGAPLMVEVSSVGGLVEVGTAIYNAIADYSKVNDVDVKMTVLGWAESVASYITTIPGAKVMVHKNSLYMYHNPTDGMHGDYRALTKKASWLEKMTNFYAEAYAGRSGKTSEEIRTGMDEETYLLGQEIVDAGFADEVIDDSSVGMSAPKEDIIKASREEYMRAMMMVSGKQENKKPALPPKENTQTNEGLKMDEEAKKEAKALLDEERKRSRACMAAMAAVPAEYHKQMQDDFDAGKEAAYFDGLVAHAKMVGDKDAVSKEKKSLEMAGKDSDELPEINTDQKFIKPGQMQMMTPGRVGKKVEVG